MPSGERGFAITVCTGIETQTVWMDRSGAIHKSDPSKEGHKDDSGNKGCAFAAAGMPMLPALVDNAAIISAPDTPPMASDFEAVAIGRGLAAPPPPSTGPPVLT